MRRRTELEYSVSNQWKWRRNQVTFSCHAQNHCSQLALQNHFLTEGSAFLSLAAKTNAARSHPSPLIQHPFNSSVQFYKPQTVHQQSNITQNTIHAQMIGLEVLWGAGLFHTLHSWPPVDDEVSEAARPLIQRCFPADKRVQNYPEQIFLQRNFDWITSARTWISSLRDKNGLCMRQSDNIVSLEWLRHICWNYYSGSLLPEVWLISTVFKDSVYCLHTIPFWYTTFTLVDFS